MDPLTFEFPDAPKAALFTSRLARDGHTHHVYASHRVVDVALPASDDPSVDLLTRDYIVLLAAHFGAYDSPRPPEPLYILKIGIEASGRTLPDTEVSIVTLAEFCRDNPEQYRTWRDPGMQEAGAVAHGGGGAAPLWRLERTAYVGRKG